MNYLVMLKAFIAAIKLVQELMPASAGKDKFETVLVLVEEAVDCKIGDLGPQLFKIATFLVETYWSNGTFKPTP